MVPEIRQALTCDIEEEEEEEGQGREEEEDEKDPETYQVRTTSFHSLQDCKVPLNPLRNFHTASKEKPHPPGNTQVFIWYLPSTVGGQDPDTASPWGAHQRHTPYDRVT